MFSSSCIICSFDENEKLKNNIFFHSCNQTIIKNLDLPNILLFILDLSSELENDAKQYYNLIRLEDDYKKLIFGEFIYQNKKYILSGALNQATINHYTAYIRVHNS